MPNENLKRPQIKPCPICGNVPLMETRSLDRGNGHGYPGCFLFSLECDVCGHVKSEWHSIYSNQDEAKITVIENWNAEVDKIEQFLQHRVK